MPETQTLTAVPSADLASFPAIRAVRLEVRVRWRRATIIPGHVIANVLRGAVGITLRQLVCPREWWDHDCHPCPLYAECAYGQVFQPTPSADAKQLRLQQDLPRPFVIEAPGLHPDDRPTPDGLTFRLMLFGTTIDRLPYFISTLDRLGHDGLGHDRVPFTIDRISALHPQGDELLFTSGCTTVALPQRVITTEDVLKSESLEPSAGGELRVEGRELRTQEDDAFPALNPKLSALSSSLTLNPRPLTLNLHFLTPMLLKSGSGIDPNGRHIPAVEIRDRPPFGVIIRRLRDRLSALCTFFDDPWRHPDFAALGTLADTVPLTESRTIWLTRDRRSTRTGHTHELSGFVGHATYQFPDAPTYATLVPLLKFAELIHLGKHAPWGNGAVRVTMLQGDTE